MKKYFALIQFLPITIFLAVAKSKGFTGNAWEVAFKWGAIAALVETVILIPLIGNKMSRLIAGANAYLILGGAAYAFTISLLLRIIDQTRESGLFIVVLLICSIATWLTDTGVFEKFYSHSGSEKKYSCLFLVGVVLTVGWSYYNSGNSLLAGTVPFIFLIVLKHLLQKKLQKI